MPTDSLLKKARRRQILAVRALALQIPWQANQWTFMRLLDGFQRLTKADYGTSNSGPGPAVRPVGLLFAACLLVP